MAGKPPPAVDSPERFTQELQDLAAKAKSNTFTTRLIAQVFVFTQIAIQLALLAVSCNVSQLNLTPVYGSIPASIHHAYLVSAACFLGWAGNQFLRDNLPLKTKTLLPIVAVCIPGFQHLLASYSQRMGPRVGPVATELATLFPLSVMTAASVADLWDEADLSFLPRFAADSAPGLLSWVVLKFLEGMTESYLQGMMGRTVLFTRLGLEIALDAAYAAVAPSKYLVYTAFPLFHTMLLNSHVPSSYAESNLAAALMSDGWLLIERRESVTGYISVLQNLQQGFRVLRCDHSLLGGEWIDHRGGPVSEPIYGVFAMLEAVRLAETLAPVADEDAKALVMYVFVQIAWLSIILMSD